MKNTKFGIHMKKMGTLLLIFGAISCAKDDNHKSHPEVPMTPVLTEENVLENSPVSIPVNTETAPSSRNLGTIKLIHKFSLSESGTPRNSDKIVSVQVLPTKVINTTGVNSSYIQAKCEETILATSNFRFGSAQQRQVETYRPSVLIPAAVVCATEIKVEIEIFGFEFELKNAVVGDVISAAQ